MQRVRFLLPDGKSINCLMNPEDVQVSSESGAQSRPTIGALQAGSPNPVQRVSGGTTKLTLKLLFDVMGERVKTDDVRDLTEPMWALTEASGDQIEEKEKVRFIWGKTWNIPIEIEKLSESLEQFTPAGTPQRSRMTVEFIADVAPQSIRKESMRSRSR